MRILLTLVVAMGVLIVVGVAVVAVTIMHRMGGHGAGGRPVAGGMAVDVPALVALDEPAGTHIGAISSVGDRLAVLLQGGGTDRVVFVDSSGRQVGRLVLRH